MLCLKKRGKGEIFNPYPFNPPGLLAVMLWLPMLSFAEKCAFQNVVTSNRWVHPSLPWNLGPERPEFSECAFLWDGPIAILYLRALLYSISNGDTVQILPQFNYGWHAIFGIFAAKMLHTKAVRWWCNGHCNITISRGPGFDLRARQEEEGSYEYACLFIRFICWAFFGVQIPFGG